MVEERSLGGVDFFVVELDPFMQTSTIAETGTLAGGFGIRRYGAPTTQSRAVRPFTEAAPPLRCTKANRHLSKCMQLLPGDAGPLLAQIASPSVTALTPYLAVLSYNNRSLGAGVWDDETCEIGESTCGKLCYPFGKQ